MLYKAIKPNLNINVIRGNRFLGAFYSTKLLKLHKNRTQSQVLYWELPWSRKCAQGVWLHIWHYLRMLPCLAVSSTFFSTHLNSTTLESSLHVPRASLHLGSLCLFPCFRGTSWPERNWQREYSHFLLLPAQW